MVEPKYKKILFDIEGMTCTGCESRIENSVGALKGVHRVKAIHGRGKAYVDFYPSELAPEQIADVVKKLGYGVKSWSYNLTSAPKSGSEQEAGGNNIVWFAAAGIVILALYVIINNTVGFNFIPPINQSMGYGILFVVGMATSLHCIAMCGGINLSVCVQYSKNHSDVPKGSKSDNPSGHKPGSKLLPSVLYNLGRVISYTVIGGLVGALGSAISFTGMAKGVVAVISGIFMLIMGLNMLNIFPGLRKITPRLPKFLGKKVHGSHSAKGPLYIGLLNGLMPCGPLQAMQIYALGTGSFDAGALSMFMFSMGTVPLMFGFGAASSLLSRKSTRNMMKVSAVLVILLGVLMLNRGLNLSGLGFVSAAKASGSSSIAQIENGVQLVTTQLEDGRYYPLTVQKGIPVRWTIQADKEDLNGCNNPVTIPKYNIVKELKPGDNVIEFTPTEEGNMIYTCWMGMISGNIKVVDDLANASPEDLQPAGRVGGGCCR